MPLKSGNMAISAAKPSKQWFSLKKEVLLEANEKEAYKVSQIQSSPRSFCNEKFLHARAFISVYVESNIVDFSPEENQENTKYIPFKKLSHFYAEY
jgi:threonyl-tRNA synthetase